MMDEQKLRVTFVARNGRRRYAAASKERLVSACLEPGVPVSRLALEHGVNAKQRAERCFLPPVPAAASIPVEIASPSDRALLRQGGMAAVDLPVSCDGGLGPASKRAAAFSSPAKVNASLPNGVKLTLDCGDAGALTALTERWVMFRLGADLKVYLHREPIDFRAGINSLAVLVQEAMALDPFAPVIFAFCNRRRDRMKLLFFDRSGFVLVLKRLTEDKFHWPRREVAVVTLTTE